MLWQCLFFSLSPSLSLLPFSVFAVCLVYIFYSDRTYLQTPQNTVGQDISPPLFSLLKSPAWNEFKHTHSFTSRPLSLQICPLLSISISTKISTVVLHLSISMLKYVQTIFNPSSTMYSLVLSFGCQEKNWVFHTKKKKTQVLHALRKSPTTVVQYCHTAVYFYLLLFPAAFPSKAVFCRWLLMGIVSYDSRLGLNLLQGWKVQYTLQLECHRTQPPR